MKNCSAIRKELQSTQMQQPSARATHDNYLGSATVVSKILEAQVREIFGWVLARSSGKMTADEMRAAIRLRGPEFSAIFAGENPDYRPVVGWNSRFGGLQDVLRVELGDYWPEQRYACGDDPYRVLYAWLVCSVSTSIMGGDTDMPCTTMGGSIQQAIRLLIGMPRLAASSKWPFPRR
ncbi:hypothetical protein [Accumulibacter sp.]|jgi:hypothetical protein|uniref:hypothetical protein n=1 Tax=Accumulibacter sp. TaxID=2053492 RepID=UPI002B75970D|nr:hypothetical protein [Accumulibacter sp.]HPU80794.1 hypothetical protein [Accumulibacter sp.]